MATLIAVGSATELEGDFTHFKSVFKRYTPFALDWVEQMITDSGTVEISRSGDILWYIYLYNWTTLPTSIDFMIGEQIINTIPTEYITGIARDIAASRYTETAYDGTGFLPVPLPKIPLNSLRYHSVRLRLNGYRGAKCQACFVYLNEPPQDTDILITQIQKSQIDTDGSVSLVNPVKYLWSTDTSSPKMYINGFDWNLTPPAVSAYYHTRYVPPFGFTSFDSYSSSGFALQGTVRTSQVVNGNVYLWTSTGNVITTNLLTKTTTTSFVGSNLVASAGLYVCDTAGKVYGPGGTVSTGVANVYAMFYSGSNLFVVGDQFSRVGGSPMSYLPLPNSSGNEVFIYADASGSSSMNVYTAFVKTQIDPFFGSVQLLLHSSTTDVSLNHTPVTGTPGTSNLYQFGSGSMSFSPGSSISFTVSPVTIEFWVLFPSLPSVTTAFFGNISVTPSGNFVYGSRTGTTQISVNTWYFLNVQGRAYVNGSDDGVSTNVPTGTLTVGNCNCLIEEIRASSVARPPLTVPTQPFPDLSTYQINYKVATVSLLNGTSPGLVDFTPTQLSLIGSPLSTYCGSVTAGGVTYFAPSTSGLFFNGTQTYQLPIQSFSAIAFDGTYVILFPAQAGGSLVFYDTMIPLTIFQAFCLDTGNPGPTGALNFSRIQAKFPKTTAGGTIWATNWNVLRIRNGMAGVLYAS